MSEVRLVNDSLALLSMRDSDFDAYSAFGEIIDNSIQANAKRIAIALDVAPAGNKGKFEVLRSIAFGDDGDGMDPHTLHRCLQLGYSSRYNDRSGIGRFGVGMTLAAINQCKRVEVYSRSKGEKWMFTYADLDDMTGQPPKLAAIPAPIEKAPPAKLKSLAGDASGTIVVWSKYDRQPETASRMKTEMHKWIGRTFRYFIWDGVTISIDDETVRTVDPLYVRWDKSTFPKDPPGEEVKPIKLEWTVPDDCQGGGDGETSTITIRLSLAHDSFWPYAGVGNTKEARARFFQDNEGISIMRNGREVFYDTIPHWPGGADWFKDKDRWWGCEISFNAVLDRAFTVKNIKRGAVPNSELKKAIYDRIVPTIKTFRDRIDKKWAAAKVERASPPEEGEVTTGHETAEGIAKATPTDRSSIDTDKDINKEAKSLVDKLKKNASDVEKAAWIAKWKSQPFTICEGGWKGPTFIEAQHLGGSDVIVYNKAHPFFEEVYAILEGLETEAPGNDATLRLKSLLDLLIIAYSKAEAKFDAALTFTAEDFVENLRQSWGMYLQSYLKTWRKEIGDDAQ
jgi:hypothetical protein